MLDSKFYWGTVRKAVVAFGNMFTSITIDRKDANDEIVNGIRVPLAYASKQKFLARIDQIPDAAEDRRVSVALPRMAFEMVGLQYDSSRKLSVIQKNQFTNASTEHRTTQFVPAPYNLEMNLYVYSKNTDDGLQIIEQILPYFNPDFNLKVKAIPELDISHDLPIILKSVDFEDDFEGNFEDKRRIIWTLSFTVKTNFYGPTTQQGFIRKAISNVYKNPDMTNAYGTYSVTPNPLTANPEDDWTFTDTFEGFK